jgi:hypothetical protein
MGIVAAVFGLTGAAATASIVAEGIIGGSLLSSALAPKPHTPKLPEPVPLPRTQDIGKMKATEKRQLQKRQTTTTMSGNWLRPPSLLTKQLG